MTAAGPGLGAVVRVRALRLSVRVAPRSAGVALALAGVLGALLLVSIGTGSFPIAPGEVVAALLGGGDRATRFVVETLRLPRALTGALVGAALGASGAIFQSVTRNPLGSPDIVGLVQGASAGAVLEIVVLGGGTAAVAGGALAGGLVTAALVSALAYRGGGIQGYRLVLVGIGIAALLVALTQYLLTRTTLAEAHAAQIWLAGSLDGRGWEHVRPVAAAVALLLPAAALLGRPLRTLELGDDAARALGVAAERTKLALVGVAVALAAVATACAGPIVFVALAAPQIARRLTRASGPGLGCAALAGAALVLAADCAGQRLFGATPMPVGVVTGALGGGYLLWLLSREWRGAAR